MSSATMMASSAVGGAKASASNAVSNAANGVQSVTSAAGNVASSATGKFRFSAMLPIKSTSPLLCRVPWNENQLMSITSQGQQQRQPQAPLLVSART